MAYAALLDHAQIRLPHIGTDKLDLFGKTFANHREELLDACHRALLADPQQARAVAVDLVDQRQVFVTLGIRDLIDPDRLNRSQSPMFKPPGDNEFDGLTHLLP